MRQSVSDLQFVGYTFGVLALFAYEITTSVFIFLPPLIGLFFAYMITEYSRWQKSYTEFSFGWYLSIAFLLFAEQINGYYLLSSIVAFFLFFNFVVDWLFATLKFRKLLLLIFVSAGYIGTYAVSNLINYILNLPLLYFSYEYAVFIAIESVLALIFLRERVS